MKKIFSLLLLVLTTTLWSRVAVTENEPSTLAEGVVNVITGDLYSLEEDIVIQGVEPIRFKRSYVSAQGAGHFSFIPHLTAIKSPIESGILLYEPNGTALAYFYDHKVKRTNLGILQNGTENKKEKKAKKKNKKYDFFYKKLDLEKEGKGLANTARGRLSAHTNLKNQKVFIRGKDDHLVVQCPDGTKRIYQLKPDQKLKREFKGKIDFRVFYHLVSEELLNGNKVLYHWEDGRVSSIRTTDPSCQRTYAIATFRYHGAVKKDKDYNNYPYYDNTNFDVHTSDGRILQYHFFSEGKKSLASWHLQRVISTDAPCTEFFYDHTGPHKNLLTAISLPHSRALKISYYNPKANHDVGVEIGDENDPICRRVKSLAAPVGADSHPVVTHKFYYNTKNRETTVIDSEEVPTRYYWDDNLHLTLIDRFSTRDNLYCSTHFVWGENNSPDAANLLCQAFYNEQRNPVHATRYIYDAKGNVLQEKFYGNLSGQGAPLSLDARKFPQENGVESATTKCEYTQDGRNLLLRKEESNGLIITYDYLPNTDLKTSELVYEQGQIKRRKFYEYNGDRVLMCEIDDDGVTPDKNNLTAVKTRRMLRIGHKPEAPYLAMPYILEEKYWGGQDELFLKATTLHYTTGGRVCKKDISDAQRQFRYSLYFTYDAEGRLIEETNALGQVAKSSYDVVGNKILFQDFSGKTTTYMTYDHANRLIESKEIGIDGLERITRHSYNQKSQKISSVDPYGHETRYVYDALGQLLETHLPPIEDQHPVIRSTYDASGCETSRTDAKEYTTHTSYNTYGKPTFIQHPDGTKETYLYTLDGSLQTHTDQKGTQTAYTYDLFNRVISKTISSQGETLSQESFVYEGFHLIAKIDAEGTRTTFEYDTAGRKIAEECNFERTEYSYDPLGRLHLEKRGDLLAFTEYDLLDRVTEERKENTSGTVLSKVQYTYDSAGNKTETRRFIQGKESLESFAYDSFNRLIQHTDPLGQITTTTYNDALHEQITTDPLGLQTFKKFNAHYLLTLLEKRSSKNELLVREENRYDLTGHLIRKETTLFEPQRSVITLWEYGPLDRLLSLSEAAETPDQRITHYTYTSTGQLYQTIKPSGITLTSSYNPLGHLTEQISSDGTVHYTYLHNRLGHRIQSKDELTGDTLFRTYDPKGRLLTETFPKGLFFRNNYDTQGRRAGLSFPGAIVTYSYDPLYLRSVTRSSSEGEPLYTHNYTDYDLAGNLLSEELIGNLGSLTHAYDAANRKISCSSPYFSQEVLQYDAVGNILSTRLQEEILNYTYDDLYQLTSEKEHTYTYDALHNRLQKDETSYTINALNQVSSDFIYSPDGNPLSHDNTHYTYDALDRLITLEKGSRKLYFTYDAYHRRLSKTTYLAETKIEERFFLYDDQNEIGSIDASGNLQELRILGQTTQAEINATIAIELQGQVYAPLHDLHGNISALVSLTDQSSEEYRYTAFGEEKTERPPSGNPWRFSSKRTDDASGLVYYGRRYYFPSYGRWLTPDPLGLEAGPNLYAFVLNAPLTHIDLYGLAWTMNDWRQIGVGAVHGLGDSVLRTGVNLSYVGYGVSFPLRMARSFMGGPSIAQDWNNFKRSNEELLAWGERSMQRILPGDINHGGYKFARSTTGEAGDMALYSLAGPAVLKQGVHQIQRAINFTSKMRMTKELARYPGVSKLTQQTAKREMLGTLGNRIGQLQARHDVNILSKAGQTLDRGGLTKAGRALDKHGGRLDSIFPKAFGNPPMKNLQGQYHLDDILTHPNSIIKEYVRPRYGNVVDIKIPGGKGVRYSESGDFLMFLEP